MADLCTLADARAHLNIPDSSQDAELAHFVSAATVVGENIAGVVLTRTITGEVLNGGGPMVQVRFPPIQSVQSVTEYVGLTGYALTFQPEGSTSSQYGYDIFDATGGLLLRRGSSGLPVPFAGGPDSVIVSYTAGYATVPENVRLGALELVRHWWQRSQLIGRRGAMTMLDDGTSLIAGYAVPNYAVGLLAATPSSARRLPGIA